MSARARWRTPAQSQALACRRSSSARFRRDNPRARGPPRWGARACSGYFPCCFIRWSFASDLLARASPQIRWTRTPLYWVMGLSRALFLKSFTLGYGKNWGSVQRTGTPFTPGATLILTRDPSCHRRGPLGRGRARVLLLNPWQLDATRKSRANRASVGRAPGEAENRSSPALFLFSATERRRACAQKGDSFAKPVANRCHGKRRARRASVGRTRGARMTASRFDKIKSEARK